MFIQNIHFHIAVDYVEVPKQSYIHSETYENFVDDRLLVSCFAFYIVLSNETGARSEH